MGEIGVETGEAQNMKESSELLVAQLENARQSVQGVSLDEEMVEIEELSSNRRLVDPNGIKIADTIFVPLEDGDRTEALKKIGKKVIAVDLNPISRTAIWADITIVDNIIRVLPEMINFAKDLKNLKKEQLINIVNNFNNKKNIIDTLDSIKEYIEAQKENAFKILE